MTYIQYTITSDYFKEEYKRIITYSSKPSTATLENTMYDLADDFADIAVSYHFGAEFEYDPEGYEKYLESIHCSYKEINN